jgi:hypothetical protein
MVLITPVAFIESINGLIFGSISSYAFADPRNGINHLSSLERLIVRPLTDSPAAQICFPPRHSYGSSDTLCRGNHNRAASARFYFHFWAERLSFHGFTLTNPYLANRPMLAVAQRFSQ